MKNHKKMTGMTGMTALLTQSLTRETKWDMLSKLSFLSQPFLAEFLDFRDLNFSFNLIDQESSTGNQGVKNEERIKKNKL